MIVKEKTDKIMKNLGILLIAEQQKLGLTNLEMALKCNISLREYNRLISRKATGCHLAIIVSILENTDISSQDIFDY